MFLRYPIDMLHKPQISKTYIKLKNTIKSVTQLNIYQTALPHITTSCHTMLHTRTSHLLLHSVLYLNKSSFMENYSVATFFSHFCSFLATTDLSEPNRLCLLSYSMMSHLGTFLLRKHILQSMHKMNKKPYPGFFFIE